MKQIFTFLVAVLITASTYAQVGIGTSSPDATHKVIMQQDWQGPIQEENIPIGFYPQKMSYIKCI